MKRSLAIILVLAAFAPAAAAIASAFNCHAMPCCNTGQTTAQIGPGCCEPTMTSNPTPGPVAKDIVTISITTPSQTSSAVSAVFIAQAHEHPDVSPPRPVRLRLATLSTLLI